MWLHGSAKRVRKTKVVSSIALNSVNPLDSQGTSLDALPLLLSRDLSCSISALLIPTLPCGIVAVTSTKKPLKQGETMGIVA